MDKMRFLKVLSIKMGVFMDKIEFFPIDAGSRGGAGAAREADREAGKAAGIAKGDGNGSGTETGVGRRRA